MANLAHEVPTKTLPSKSGPLIAFVLLAFSIWLVFINDNTFLLIPPVVIAVWCVKGLRRNRWYWLPLIPSIVGIALMMVALIIGWTSTT
ncbi:hypothetical protein ADIAG_03053 [Paeniglutamicibacter gangotriensis Lz1y]|uniref:Uncharacterized protein n=1 Tax=Paeniglutamicibacter gangotriensis Lz1y TaxID=1276920 RepID=M7NGN1_9MICC|nr:cytochrome bd terminal oxidase subunit II [Arthrobacter sp.]EMQ97673.1 hypothetical protein ADIAG_03053 [Paeniglutamicibacter gangotriensis Lz1y]